MLKRPLPLLLALLAAMLIAAGCGDDGTDTTTVADGAETTTDSEAEEVLSYLFPLTAIDTGEEMGSVSASDTDEGLMVSIEVSSAGESHPAHIHSGTCNAPGPVAYPLANVEGGTSQTTVDGATVDEVFAGPHLAAVHEDGGAPGEIIACAPLTEDVGVLAGDS